MGQFALDATSLQAVITAFHKVWANLDALRDPMASAA
jgi:hypothetical protein